MAGFWPLSLLQRVDRNGRPYIGAKAYFYEALTLDPLTVYQDYGLGTPHPFPIQSDGNGMFPAVFLDEADGFYRFRITTSGGETLLDLTQMPIIGPTAGEGGSEEPVDPNRIWKTGDLKARYGTGTHAGWVRANGRTIGSATSGATERANADCQALYELLWNAASNTILPVAGGRGANASADWSANKAIALPDLRGRTIAGLDDMGNVASTRLASTYVATGNATTLGSSGGLDDVAITVNQMPSHPHTFSGTTSSNGGHTVPTYSQVIRVADQASQGPDVDNVWWQTSNFSVASHAHTYSGTTSSVGGGAAHNNMPPFALATLYICL